MMQTRGAPVMGPIAADRDVFHKMKWGGMYLVIPHDDSLPAQLINDPRRDPKKNPPKFQNQEVPQHVAWKLVSYEVIVPMVRKSRMDYAGWESVGLDGKNASVFCG